MKSITRFIFISFLFLTISQLFTNCTKESIPDPNFLGTHTIAEGIVLEYGTLKPVKNAKVILRECESEILQGSFCGPIDTFLTDSDGTYFIDFKHKTSGGGAVFEDASFSYELRVAADNYLLNRSNQLFLKKEYINRDTAVMDPHAWIKFHVKNVDPFDENDEILLGGFIEANFRPEIKGQDIDTNWIARTLGGNRETPIRWTVVRNNERISYHDTIYIPAFDTLNYEILF